MRSLSVKEISKAVSPQINVMTSPAFFSVGLSSDICDSQNGKLSTTGKLDSGAVYRRRLLPALAVLRHQRRRVLGCVWHRTHSWKASLQDGWRGYLHLVLFQPDSFWGWRGKLLIIWYKDFHFRILSQGNIQSNCHVPDVLDSHIACQWTARSWGIQREAHGNLLFTFVLHLNCQ